MSSGSDIPALPKLPMCKICQNAQRYDIQKGIDNGASIGTIASTYGIAYSTVKNHIDDGHRDTMIAYFAMERVLQQKAINVIQVLTDFVEAWKDQPKGTIKNQDGIKAAELVAKLQGVMVDKHEIKVTKTTKEVFNDILGEDEEEYIENKKEEKVKELVVIPTETVTS